MEVNLISIYDMPQHLHSYTDPDLGMNNIFNTNLGMK